VGLYDEKGRGRKPKLDAEYVEMVIQGYGTEYEINFA